MTIYLLDQADIHTQLLPLTYTRPISDLRVGILTIKEKWQHLTKATTVSITTSYLQKETLPNDGQSNWVVNGSLCPSPELIESIQSLGENQKLMKEGQFLAAKASVLPVFDQENFSTYPSLEFEGEATLIERPYHIFGHNGDQIRNDYKILTEGRKSVEITDPHTVIYGAENIFLEEGSSVKACILNAENGPIYIGKNAQVQEGAIIKGPFALCEGSHVNIGAKVRGDSTIGPHSKIGGEVSNSVILGFSNKAHDGYLGNSVIGEWCNLGADTNTSNLKNNYDEVKIWDYAQKSFRKTGLQFCGLIMGDHSKCGINTMFNTGTVVGVSANIYGSGFPRNFVPSFSWGGSSGFTSYQLKKAIKTAQIVFSRKNIEWSDNDASLFEAIFEKTAAYRIWDKKSES